MGFVVKIMEGAGGGWITKLNTQGVRSVGSLRHAQVFPTYADAQHEVERLADHLPVGILRLKIEQK